MGIKTKQRVQVAIMFALIVAAFVTYEIFNKASYSYPPFVMRGWADEKLHIISPFVIPYISFHVLAMVVVPVLSLKFGNFYQFLTNAWAIVVGQLMLDVAYFFFQTEVPRPTNFEVHNVFDWLLKNLVWGNDRPLNGFPSNHVTWSVISIIALWRMRHRIPKTAYGLIAWFGLIIPATVLLAQHFLIDIYGGVFVGFAVYWATMFVVERPLLVSSRNQE